MSDFTVVVQVKLTGKTVYFSGSLVWVDLAVVVQDRLGGWLVVFGT